MPCQFVSYIRLFIYLFIFHLPLIHYKVEDQLDVEVVKGH